MAAIFPKGEVVVLKSGGPQMTVSRIIESDSASVAYECTWFEKNTLRNAQFDEEIIEKYTFSFGIG